MGTMPRCENVSQLKKREARSEKREARSKSLTAAIVLAAVLCLLPIGPYALSQALAAPPVPGGEVNLEFTSLEGATRYETNAKAVSELCKADVNGVIVVSGKSYADATSASGLAGLLGYPVVYSAKDGLCDQAMSFLDEKRPSQVIVIGGLAAVSDKVATALQELPYVEVVERIGGANRYETASMIYEYGASQVGGWSSGDAIIVGGENFPDSVSIASYAAYSGSPVFLARMDQRHSIDDEVVQACALQNRTVIVGGSRAVPLDVEEELSRAGVEAMRLAGANRYATNMEVVQFCLSGDYRQAQEPPSDVFAFTDYVATGNSFADALSVGIAASIGNASPAIVYLADNCTDAQKSIKAMPARSGFTTLNTCFIGGQRAIPQKVRASVEAAIRANTPAECRLKAARIGR